jgi:hypothetical protein
MVYTGTKCKSCGEINGISEAPKIPKAQTWINRAWKARLTCPLCGATNDYTGDDLDFYEGEVSDQSPV